MSIIFLAVLVGMLTLSTYFHVPAGLFFAFVLLNGVAQAAAGSYLQTAIVAVASLFGPTAMQSVMSGQGAVGVAISLVQAISAYTSVHRQPSSETNVTVVSEPEEQSAFMFFSISTLFLLVSAAAQAWLFRLPAYKSIVGQFNQISHEEADAGLETSSLVSHPHRTADIEKRRSQILRVAKTNGVYNFAVAYVFLITLVCTQYLEVSGGRELTCIRNRLFFLPSLSQSNLQIHPHIHLFSVPFTSSYSIPAISSVVICVPSRVSPYGLPNACFHSHYLEPYLSPCSFCVMCNVPQRTRHIQALSLAPISSSCSFSSYLEQVTVGYQVYV